MILAVAAGKGGVGKTTLSLNLAHELDAVVVDADLGMADLPAGRGPDLHDVLAGRADPLEAVRAAGEVTVLPCGRTLVGARAADPAALVEVLGRVEREYGTVVVDCPAGLAADVGLPLYAADRCVLVVTPDAVALPDAIRTRELARELGAGLSRVALNRAGSDPPTRRVERALGAPVVTVPDHREVAAAQAAGRPVAVAASDCPAVGAFEKLARAVSGGSTTHSSRRS